MNLLEANRKDELQLDKQGTCQWPKIVYKFLDSIGGRLALNEKTIKFTDFQSLNDPFECIPKGISWSDANRIIREAERAKNDDSLWAAFYEKCEYLKALPVATQNQFRDNPKKCFQEEFRNLDIYVRRLVEAHRDKTGETIAVASFSQCKKSLTMWSHYADRHRGVVIGYAPTCFHRIFPEGESFLKVQYSNDRLEIPLEPESLWGCLDRLVTTKSIAWAHEKEWRCVVLASNPELKYGYFLEQVLPEEILEINIGACADPFLKRVCLDFYRKHPTCRLLEAKLQDTSYALDFQKPPWVMEQ